jgi:protein gp37
MRPHEGTHDGAARLPQFDPAVHCSSVYDMLHWVIAGGESGPHARPAHPDWFRSLRDQCEAAGVAFHFKQWGEWCPAACIVDDDDRELAEAWIGRDRGVFDPRFCVEFFHGDALVYRAGKKAAGRLLDGVEHNGFPA